MELWLFEIQWYNEYENKIITDRGITFESSYSNVAEKLEKRYENIKWVTITPVNDELFFAKDLEQFRTWVEIANENE